MASLQNRFEVGNVLKEALADLVCFSAIEVVARAEESHVLLGCKSSFSEPQAVAAVVVDEQAVENRAVLIHHPAASVGWREVFWIMKDIEGSPDQSSDRSL